jgi:Protein of unknown function (DUF3455)
MPRGTSCNAVECFAAANDDADGETIMRAVYVTALLGVNMMAAAAEPQIPAEIKVPEGQKLVLKAHATGYQVYTCKAHADGAPQWELKAPDAQLHDAKGAVVGQHFAGPTWKYKDGSEVTGKASAHVDSPDANSVPWLLLAATGHTGTGLFANVSNIQRINTQGGKAPAAGGCTAAADGTESKIAYSADYYFYAPGKW